MSIETMENVNQNDEKERTEKSKKRGEYIEKTSHGKGWIYFNIFHFLYQWNHLYGYVFPVSFGSLHMQRYYPDPVWNCKDYRILF